MLIDKRLDNNNKKKRRRRQQQQQQQQKQQQQQRIFHRQRVMNKSVLELKPLGLVHTFRFSPGREITDRSRAQLGALKHLLF